MRRNIKHSLAIMAISILITALTGCATAPYINVYGNSQARNGDASWSTEGNNPDFKDNYVKVNFQGEDYFVLRQTLANCAVVKNVQYDKPYTVLGADYLRIKQVQFFVQKGIASWYGPTFDGKATANGEIYNMYALTAAHKTLPLNSDIEIMNLQTNSKSKVRINDRGPFHQSRIVDLSKTAANQLDVIGPGSAPVVLYTPDTPQFMIDHYDDIVALAEASGGAGFCSDNNTVNTASTGSPNGTIPDIADGQNVDSIGVVPKHVIDNYSNESNAKRDMVYGDKNASIVYMNGNYSMQDKNPSTNNMSAGIGNISSPAPAPAADNSQANSGASDNGSSAGGDAVGNVMNSLPTGAAAAGVGAAGAAMTAGLGAAAADGATSDNNSAGNTANATTANSNNTNGNTAGNNTAMATPPAPAPAANGGNEEEELKGKFGIQLGVFSQLKNAINLASQFKHARIVDVWVNNNMLSKVVVDGFETQAEAETELAKIKKTYPKAYIVKL